MDRLFREFHADLRGLAAAVMSSQDASHTLQPTALIGEAWLKLAGRVDPIHDRTHFFALAARVMRQIITDHARGKLTEKRGGTKRRITLIEGSRGDADLSLDIVAFHDALERLGSLNERHAKLVELRLLGMLSIPEIADLTGCSERTVKRDWQAARLWLATELRDR